MTFPSPLSSSSETFLWIYFHIFFILVILFYFSFWRGPHFPFLSHFFLSSTPLSPFSSILPFFLFSYKVIYVIKKKRKGKRKGKRSEGKGRASLLFSLVSSIADLFFPFSRICFLILEKEYESRSSLKSGSLPQSATSGPLAALWNGFLLFEIDFECRGFCELQGRGWGRGNWRGGLFDILNDCVWRLNEKMREDYENDFETGTPSLCLYWLKLPMFNFSSLEFFPLSLFFRRHKNAPSHLCLSSPPSPSQTLHLLPSFPSSIFLFQLGSGRKCSLSSLLPLTLISSLYLEVFLLILLLVPFFRKKTSFQKIYFKLVHQERVIPSCLISRRGVVRDSWSWIGRRRVRRHGHQWWGKSRK